MGIPNNSVTQNEIEEKRRQEAAEELREEQRRKADLPSGQVLCDRAAS